MGKLVFHGHSCFTWNEEGKKIILDPWLNGNPLADIKPQDVNVDAILVTHGHFDHLGDAIEISKKTGAVIVGTAELANYCQRQGAKTHGMQIGGDFQFDFGWVKMTPAWHGSSVMTDNGNEYTGMPGGFLVKLKHKLLYHAGDTGLFGDMKLIGDLNKINIALLPIGGNFVMGPDDAAVASEFLHPEVVIPMHYNTFELIKQDPLEFKEKAEKKGTVVKVLAPGESCQF